MKNIILSLSFLAFMASCSSNEQKPADADMDASVAADDSAYKEEAPAADAAPAEAPAADASADPNAAGLALIEGSDCLSCHKVDTKLVGPSYQEVAAKYTDADIDKLAQKIIDGGKGVWGEIPMTAHANVSMEDAKTMVKYILAQKK